MKNWIAKAVMAGAVLAAPFQAMGEDIDLFLGPSSNRNDAPNVLIILDNTGNWTAPFAAEKAALVNVFTALGNLDADLNVGIQFFTETGGGNSNVDGGYIRAAIRSMKTPTGVGTEVQADLYADLIDALHERDDKSNSGKAGLAMAEAYFYYAGLAPEAGNNKKKVDWGIDGGVSNTHLNHANAARATCCAESHPVWALDGSALDAEGSSLYNSPVADNFCGGNYIIYISNGAVQDSNADNVRANNLLEGVGGDSTQIAISPSGSAEVVADEWARFMKEDDLSITTFTIDVNKVTTGQGPGWTRLLQSMAEESGGTYYDVSTLNAGDLAAALRNAISKILSVNSVYASVALPASSNAQSQFLNQVFMGQFRPDEDAKPRWPGNMKQYKLGLVGPDLKLLDADEVPVVEGTTGFIQECARSFWTPTTADTYWAPPLTPAGTCPDPGFDPRSNSPDGPIVEKGGQAYMLRAMDPVDRNVLTCVTCPEATASGMKDFVHTNGDITGAMLDPNNPLGVIARAAVISWGKGFDVQDEDGDTSVTDMRASAHHDVLHSQPVAVNYAAVGDPAEVVVYYGANDGMLHAVNGNRLDSQGTGSDTVLAGEEFWSFMPPEFFPDLRRLALNTEIIKFPATGTFSVGAVGSPKPYGMDGAVTDLLFGTDRFLYATMRRGGRSIYSFDITDRWNPELKWRVGCPNLTNDTGCLTSPNDWTNVGQTWSPANVAYAPGYATAPVLFVGGGYDGCEDFDNGSTQNHSCSGSFKGNSIYVLDADSGDILLEFPTDRPVAGVVTVVPVSAVNNALTYAYATDTGGNVYRISGESGGVPVPIGNLDPTVPGNWIITKIADVGCSTTTDCVLNRKFLFGPDVVRVPNSDQIAVLIGSGDREKPLEDYGAAKNVNNYFYSLIDNPLDPTWLDYDALDPDDFNCGSSVICMGSLASVNLSGTVDPMKRGFKLPLATGEQVVSAALVLTDVANFSTHIPEPPLDPNAPVCGGLGTATTYNIDYLDAEGDTVNIIGGGLPPSPVGGIVELDDGTKVEFCIGCGGEGSAIGGSRPGSASSHQQGMGRVYWNIKQ